MVPSIGWSTETPIRFLTFLKRATLDRDLCLEVASQMTNDKKEQHETASRHEVLLAQ